MRFSNKLYLVFLALVANLLLISGCSPAVTLTTTPYETPTVREATATQTSFLVSPTATITPAGATYTYTPQIEKPTQTSTSTPQSENETESALFKVDVYSDNPAHIAIRHVSGSDIVLLDASGNLVRVVRFSWKRAFPIDLHWVSGAVNGFVVSTTSDEQLQLWRIDPQKNLVELLYEMDQKIGIEYPQLSPDGKYVMYALWSGRFLYMGATVQDIEVFAIEDPSQNYRLTQNGGGAMKGGVWSPTGDLVAFTDFDSNGTQQLFISKPDGSDLRQITSGNDPTREIRSVRWSPDGSQLVFDAPGQPNKSDIWIYLIARDYLYSLPYDILELSISQKSIWWVDSGAKLLFAASAKGASERGIFIWSPEGGPRNYLPEETLQNEPAWVFPINDNGLVGFSAGQFLPGYDIDTTVFYQWNSASEVLTYFTDSTKFNLSEFPDMIENIVVVGYP